MQIFMRILKELGIALLFLLLILAVLAFAFYDKVPFGKQIPESIKYTNINKDDYKPKGDVEDKANATQTYETSTSQLESYLTEKIVSPGRFDPFNPINSVSDVPTEKINGSVNNNVSSQTPVQTPVPADDSSEEKTLTQNDIEGESTLE